jgi:N-acetyl-gamma-glutamyl-phosphate reductase
LAASCVADGSARVAVLGASGYAGAIAAMLVHRHPFFALAHVTARSEAGARLDDLHPRSRVPMELEAWDPDVQGDVDAALVCWPHGAAAPAVAALRQRGVRVVDLSADFRLRDPGVYADWYGEHGAPELFGHGVYGLPELHREAIASAGLVANPGCYPTAALLALAPLARAGLLGDVVVDAKSGVSGAGREPTATTHFIAADENVTPYKVERHRHTPEIEQELAGQGAPVTITFTPHLVPLAQGELVSCYVTPAADHDEGDVMALYDDAYADEPWVEIRLGPPGVLDVRETNYCRISVHCDGRTGRILVFGAIDNLWKGAASQAVQNLNVMFGRDEREGLG